MKKASICLKSVTGNGETLERTNASQLSFNLSRFPDLFTEAEADEVASGLVAHTLRMQGYSPTFLTRDYLRNLNDADVSNMHDAVVISVVAPSGIIFALKQLRHFHALSSNLKLIIGIWNARGEMIKTRERLIGAGADCVATDLLETVKQLDQLSVQPKPGTSHRSDRYA